MSHSLFFRRDEHLPSAWRFLGVCLTVAVLTVLARLPFVLQPGLSIDSYFYVSSMPSKEQLFSQGRFGQYMVFMTGRALGFDMVTFATLLQGVGLFCFAAAVPLFFMAFCRERVVPNSAVVLSSLFFTVHPFSAEILTFSEASFTAQFAAGVGIAATYMVARQSRLWWCGAILLVIAMSMYQLVLNYIALMLLLGAIQLIVCNKNEDFFDRQHYSGWIGVLFMLVIGFIAYMVIYKSINFAVGVSDTGRSQLLSFEMLGTRMDEIRVLALSLIDRPYLVKDAPLASALMWIASAAGWLVFTTLMLLKRPRGYIFCLPLALLLPVAGIGLVAVGQTWWPVPRVLGGVVLVWAVGIYWLLTCVKGRYKSSLAYSLVFIPIIGAVAIGHRIHSDQILLNGHDRNLAAAVYVSLNEHELFNDATRIAVVNRNMRWSHALPISTTYMDMNISAFALAGAQQGVLRLATGRELITIEPTDEHVIVCDRIPTWPKVGFTEILPSGDAVVCL